MPEQKPRRCSITRFKLRYFFEAAVVLFGLYGILGGSRFLASPPRKEVPQIPQDSSSLSTQQSGRQFGLMSASVAENEGSGLVPERPPLSDHQILLATHSRILLYDYVLDSTTILHEGLGVYYGIIPGERDGLSKLTSVWVVTRPHQWREGVEYLTHISIRSGAILGKVEIDSKFTHDATRFNDRVYVCDTGRGNILELRYPSMEKVRRFPLFTLKDHINTLNPIDSRHVWVVQHNLGKSSAVLVDTVTSEKLESLPNIGSNSHGFCLWRDSYVILDSLNGRLLAIDITTKLPREVWRTGDSKAFLKGLLVMGDMALFGKSPRRPRASRFDTDFDVELVAVDLFTGSMVWTRQIPTQGLLNIIYSPLLGSSKSVVSYSSQANENGGEEILEKNGVGGYWPSGFPYFDLHLLRETKAHYNFQLNLTTVNINPFLDFLNSLGPEVWTDEYQQQHNIYLNDPRHNIAHVKPGVKAILIIFSGNGASSTYWLPNWKRFEGVTLPLLEEIFGENCLNKVVRLQIARMPAGSRIKLHTDVGGYAEKCHRVHIPLTSPPGITFEACKKYGVDCQPIHLHPGHVFEIDNMRNHRVLHTGHEDRIHIVVDISEQEVPHGVLNPGDKCHYMSGDLSCHS